MNARQRLAGLALITLSTNAAAGCFIPGQKEYGEQNAPQSCGTILCLAGSGGQPCNEFLNPFTAIKCVGPNGLDWDATIDAREDWLEVCPDETGGSLCSDPGLYGLCGAMAAGYGRCDMPTLLTQLNTLKRGRDGVVIPGSIGRNFVPGYCVVMRDTIQTIFDETQRAIEPGLKEITNMGGEVPVMDFTNPYPLPVLARACVTTRGGKGGGLTTVCRERWYDPRASAPVLALPSSGGGDGSGRGGEGGGD